jgi:hypothetical protein
MKTAVGKEKSVNMFLHQRDDKVKKETEVL